MSKIIFRADGNSETGLGHLYRIFALIEMYKNNFDCLLLTKENTSTSIIPEEYNYKTIPNTISIENEPEWLIENYNAQNAWLIADGYHFTSSYQKKIKELNYKLVYIDDMCSEEMYANIVINHSLAVKKSNYIAQPYTQFALGTQYAILRPLFIKAAKSMRRIEKMETAFVCFGGADPFNLTIMATLALLEFDKIKDIHIVIGAANKHNDIFELAKKNTRVKIRQNVSEKELIEIMQTCDFAIAPSSNILYELCAVKMPVISGYYVENQENLYKGTLEKQIIHGAGNFKTFTVNDFKQKVTDLLAENKPQKYLEAQANLFDGKIKKRFLGLLTEIVYRKAGPEDMLLLFDWANDKLSRSNSYSSATISLETHKTWFEKKLKDERAFFYIAEIDNKPAGLVRYEVSGKNAVVGILIGEDFRGSGLAACFLRDTAELYFKECSQPVFAYIKQDNTASVRSFENANYAKLREELVQGYNSFVYKLGKYDV